MKNIFLISSPDKYIINKKVNSIINKNKDCEVITYDLEEVTISDVLEDINTYDLFNTRKIVVANNAIFLTTEKSKNIEHNIDQLEKYINNPNPDNILILTSGKVDSKKKIVKLLKEKCEFIEENEINIVKEIEKNLEDYKIDNKTINYLISYLNNDNYRIINELEKLKLYKLQEKEITINDIDDFVTRNIDDNIFELIDNIVLKNKKEAFIVYQDLILKNEDPIKIMILLANKFRLLYQVKILSNTMYKNEDIANVLGCHPYPVKLARNIVNKYSEKDLIKILKSLADMDLDIKSGNTYKDIAFELFILSL